MRRLLLIAAFLLLSCFGRAQAPDSLQLAALDAKLEEFFQSLASESVAVKNAEADFLIGSCTTDAVRDHVAIRIYDHYMQSSLMGDEGVAVHLADTWFIPGKAHFTNEIDLMNARIYAEFNRSTLLGEKAPVLTASRPDGTPVRVPSEGRISVIFLYDTDCAKCKLETMLLRAAFAEEDFPVDFIAFYVGDKAQEWERFRTEELAFKAPSLRMVHAWDPSLDTDFQRLYGVLQTPRMFVADRDGTIVGRGLDTQGLLKLLRNLLPKVEYGSEASQALFEKVFGPLEPSVTEEDVRMVADHLAGRALAERDTLFYKQMTGDLLMYLSGQRGEGYKAGMGYVADSLVLGKPEIWTTQDDSLQVLSLAGLMKDLLDRAPFGSKLPRLRVLGTLYTAKGTRAVRRNLRCLRGPAAVFFYSEGCGTCEAEKAAIPAVVVGGMKVFLVDVDALMRGNPSLAEKLLETFDLSSLPFILQTDRKGRITRKYLSLQE